jgi:SpoVK/Ycf46/Vps4 family AAA+-type ATPase
VVDLVSCCQEAMAKCVKRIVTNIESEKSLILEDFLLGYKEVVPVLKREGFAKIPTTKLDDIGALEHIKEALIN